MLIPSNMASKLHLIFNVYVSESIQENILLPTTNGFVQQRGYYVPKFTLENNPQYSTFYGYIGEANRQKVVTEFLQPITWKEYCTEVVTEDDCMSGNDAHATRLPLNDEEASDYVSYPDYIGYFRDTTNKTACKNDGECFGNFINDVCEINPLSEPMMYWNNIPLKSKGNHGHNGGYSWYEQKQIGMASYFTKSNVMMLLSEPSSYRSHFVGSEGEWVRVQFPESNKECRQFQLQSPINCTNQVDRIGNSQNIPCDFPVKFGYKVISQTLKDAYDSVHDTKKSPALEFLQTFMIDSKSMQNIFDDIANTIALLWPESDVMGYSEREGACKWLYENIEKIESAIPKGYPRGITEHENGILFLVATIVSIVVLCIVLFTATVIYIFRKAHVVRYSQLPFLGWMIGGMMHFL